MAKRRLLIVDDVDEMRLLLEQAVRSHPGLDVSGLASDTGQARLEVQRRRPDAVLLDEVLPGESALDFAEELHRDGIRIILVTGMLNPSHPIPPLALGRLQKPEWRTLERDQPWFTQAIVDMLSRQ